MGIKLSISNIAWLSECDFQVYEYMKNSGFDGLEIAPTRIFPENPYEKKTEAEEFAKRLRERFELKICSMQSIWYGRSEKIFGSDRERRILLDYTKQAIEFAASVGAGNLVFGCPKNRIISENDDGQVAVEFFRELGDYAAEHGTVLAMEANPVIYGTNYVNKTNEAIELIEKVKSKGFKLNLDLGTIIYNEESLDEILRFNNIINHVHISEPNMKLIERRPEHRLLIEMLKTSGYDGYVSIEMGKREDIQDVFNTMDYIAELIEV